jgi:lipoate synthase
MFYEKYSYFYTFFSNTINKTLIKFRLKESWNDFYSKSFTDKMFIKSTLDKILELNNYCKKRNIKFVIHNIPELRDLDNYKFNKETKLIENFAKKYDIKFINSHIILKQYEEEKLWVTVKDPHANDFAHKIIGQYLSNSLKSILN